MSGVRLRALLIEDAATLAGWQQDLTLCTHADWRPNTTDHLDVDDWERRIASAPSDLLRLIAVCGGESVGYADLHGHGRGSRELGYVVAPSDRWGQGLGTAIAHAALDYGFAVLDLDRIWAEALQANVASVRVLQRLGLRETGWGGPAQFLGEPSRYRQFEITQAQWSPTEGSSYGTTGA